jgi:2-hydroxy-6-oxonona-2,4-dienedioate hydrolase
MIATGVLQLSILAILLGGSVYAYPRFQAEMKAAQVVIDAYDTIEIETSFGHIELVDCGIGFPTLSIHGTGGGFDQGLALAAWLQRAGYRIVSTIAFWISRCSSPGAQ